MILGGCSPIQPKHPGFRPKAEASPFCADSRRASDRVDLRPSRALLGWHFRSRGQELRPGGDATWHPEVCSAAG